MSSPAAQASTDAKANQVAVPPAELQSYMDLNFNLDGDLAKNLMARLDAESACDELRLSDIVGDQPANLTPAMAVWYSNYVTPARASALYAISQLFKSSSKSGAADGFSALFRQSALDEKFLRDKKVCYSEQKKRFRNDSLEMDRLEESIAKTRRAYDNRRTELGRDAIMINQPLYLGVLIFVMFGSEALLNFESFEALPWASPAIAWGATIVIGIAIGLAAHFVGTVFKQYAYYFGAAEDDTRRGPVSRRARFGSLADLSSVTTLSFWLALCGPSCCMTAIRNFRGCANRLTKTNRDARR